MHATASDALAGKAEKCCDLSKKQVSNLVVTEEYVEDGTFIEAATREKC